MQKFVKPLGAMLIRMRADSKQDGKQKGVSDNKEKLERMRELLGQDRAKTKTPMMNLR
ncbi:hypothetical protein SARC_17751, partial [Sphaeroforma arctica JP610]